MRGFLCVGFTETKLPIFFRQHGQHVKAHPMSVLFLSDRFRDVQPLAG